MKKNKITTALVALTLLMSTGTNITSCTNEVDALDTTQGNSTAGKLGIVSLSSNGVSLAVRNAAQSRVTIEDGTAAATPQPNRAISSFTAGDVVTTRYHFVSIGNGTANGTVPPASIYNGSATASGTEPLEWKMSDSNATNPLQPSEDKTGESWTEARMEISYAPAAEAYEEELTASPDGKTTVRQYYDALVASSLSTPTSMLPGVLENLIAGKLYIERTDEATLGAVTANLAHSGALMQLKADKTTISGFAEGFDCLTHLLARATIKEGTDASAPGTVVYIRFSPVTLTGGSTVWQAIVPAGTVVSGFTATIGLLSQVEAETKTTATYHIALPTATKAMLANTSYQLSLKLTPDVQTFAVSGAPTLPGWPEDDTEVKWENVVNVKFNDTNPGQADNVRTYTEVKNVEGLMEVIDYINGTNYSETNADNVGTMHLNTNVHLTALHTYDLSQVYKAAANDTKPAFLPIGSGTVPDGYGGEVSTIYTGTFDGHDATIHGLYIDIAREYNGLFAKSTGTITDIDLTGVNINITTRIASEYVGGIVGYNGNQVNGKTTPGNVTNCTVQGKITNSSNNTTDKSGSYFGGVAGRSIGYSVVENCTVNIDLSYTVSAQTLHIGGVVGNNQGKTVGCTATGTVSYSGENNNESKYVGGITGSITNSDLGVVMACISAVNVSSTSTASNSGTGGVSGNSIGQFRGCYSTGAVSGVGQNTYGVVNETFGRESGSKNNYWVKPSSPESTATLAINTERSTHATRLADGAEGITELNGKVADINAAIAIWNRGSTPAMQCNFHFVASSDNSTPPTLAAGAPTAAP